MYLDNYHSNTFYNKINKTTYKNKKQICKDIVTKYFPKDIMDEATNKCDTEIK